MALHQGEGQLQIGGQVTPVHYSIDAMLERYELDARGTVTCADQQLTGAWQDGAIVTLIMEKGEHFPLKITGLGDGGVAQVTMTGMPIAARGAEAFYLFG